MKYYNLKMELKTSKKFLKYPRTKINKLKKKKDKCTFLLGERKKHKKKKPSKINCPTTTTTYHTVRKGVRRRFH